MLSIGNIPEAWSHFLKAEKDCSICGIIRMAYSLLLGICMLFFGADLERWFGESGVLPYTVSRNVIGRYTQTIFTWLPHTHSVLLTCYTIFLLQILLLFVGLFSRMNAVCVYIWLISFQHRANIILDGEDSVFRLLGFILIFMPIGAAYSLDSILARRAGKPRITTGPVWPLRLMQFQMTLIYLSAALEKLSGEDWRSGYALYYVTRLDDSFGKFPLPASLLNSLTLLQLLTWTVMTFEFSLPFALWYPRTRRIALVCAVIFHLTIEYSMNLFLFHWIMLVGLLSFLQQEDLFRKSPTS